MPTRSGKVGGREQAGAVGTTKRSGHGHKCRDREKHDKRKSERRTGRVSVVSWSFGIEKRGGFVEQIEVASAESAFARLLTMERESQPSGNGGDEEKGQGKPLGPRQGDVWGRHIDVGAIREDEAHKVL